MPVLIAVEIALLFSVTGCIGNCAAILGCFRASRVVAAVVGVIDTLTILCQCCRLIFSLSVIGGVIGVIDTLTILCQCCRLIFSLSVIGGVIGVIDTLTILCQCCCLSFSLSVVCGAVGVVDALAVFSQCRLIVTSTAVVGIRDAAAIRCQRCLSLCLVVTQTGITSPSSISACFGGFEDIVGDDHPRHPRDKHFLPFFTNDAKECLPKTGPPLALPLKA